MRIRKIKAIWWLAVRFLASGLAAQATGPPPGELIAKAVAAQRAQTERGRKYTYREDHSESQVDKIGKAGPPSVRTYDHIMLEGAEYKKLILVDGKPLDAKTQKKVDDDLEKACAERRKRGPLTIQRNVSLGPIEFLTRLFDNKVTGEETILGRRTWRMESEPKTGARPANKQEQEALASRRTNWFDQEDGMQVKERDEFIRAANGFQPGTIIDLNFFRIGDDWLPANFEMQVEMKVIPGIHARVDSRQHYYDYKLFSVDSTLTSR